MTSAQRWLSMSYLRKGLVSLADIASDLLVMTEFRSENPKFALIVAVILMINALMHAIAFADYRRNCTDHWVKWLPWSFLPLYITVGGFILVVYPVWKHSTTDAGLDYEAYQDTVLQIYHDHVVFVAIYVFIVGIFVFTSSFMYLFSAWKTYRRPAFVGDKKRSRPSKIFWVNENIVSNQETGAEFFAFLETCLDVVPQLCFQIYTSIALQDFTRTRSISIFFSIVHLVSRIAPFCVVFSIPISISSVLLLLSDITFLMFAPSGATGIGLAADVDTSMVVFGFNVDVYSCIFVVTTQVCFLLIIAMGSIQLAVQMKRDGMRSALSWLGLQPPTDTSQKFYLMLHFFAIGVFLLVSVLTAFSSFVCWQFTGTRRMNFAKDYDVYNSLNVKNSPIKLLPSEPQASQPLVNPYDQKYSRYISTFQAEFVLFYDVRNFFFCLHSYAIQTCLLGVVSSVFFGFLVLYGLFVTIIYPCIQLTMLDNMFLKGLLWVRLLLLLVALLMLFRYLPDHLRRLTRLREPLDFVDEIGITPLEQCQ